MYLSTNVQKADRKFIESLLSLIRNIQRAIELHQNLPEDMHSPAELMTGSFDGIKVVIHNLSLNVMSIVSQSDWVLVTSQLL